VNSFEKERVLRVLRTVSETLEWLFAVQGFFFINFNSEHHILPLGSLDSLWKKQVPLEDSVRNPPGVPVEGRCELPSAHDAPR